MKISRAATGAWQRLLFVIVGKRGELVVEERMKR
jgi:hypothetical protein